MDLEKQIKEIEALGNEHIGTSPETRSTMERHSELRSHMKGCRMSTSHHHD